MALDLFEVPQEVTQNLAPVTVQIGVGVDLDGLDHGDRDLDVFLGPGTKDVDGIRYARILRVTRRLHHRPRFCIGTTSAVDSPLTMAPCRSTASRSGSRLKWLYREVVLGCVCPNSAPMTGRENPAPTRLEAKL